MAEAIVSPGSRFGRLTVIAPAPRTHSDRWTVRCDCGTVKDVYGSTLRAGRTQSCGCYRAEVAALNVVGSREVHGHGHNEHRTPTYNSWRAMRGRCTRPTDIAWKHYGGRGITVCDRWQSFENFLADMGERPDGTTLDRVDVDGHYEPDNCRWATAAVQNINRREG